MPQAGLPVRLFFFLILLLAAGCGTKMFNESPLTSISFVDRNGFSETISNQERLDQFGNIDFLTPQPYEKVTRVFARDKEGVAKSYLTTYHPNGQLWQYLEVVNGRALGSYREWHPNGHLKLEALLVGGNADLSPFAQRSWIFDGPCKVYNDKGVLLAYFPYEKGMLHGVAQHFYSDGALWKQEPYNQGLLEGTVEEWLSSGELLERTKYKDGMKCGQAMRYWPHAQTLAYEETWSKGWLYEGLYYHRDGSLLSQIHNGQGKRALFDKEGLRELQEFRGGKQEGLVTVFDKSLRKIATYSLKDGLKQGEEIQYHLPPSSPFSELCPEELPKLQLNWQEGILQGVVRTWYDHGILESQKEMVQNKKSGVCTAWYQDGSLMLVEEYRNDILVNGEYYRQGEKTPISRVIQGKGTASLFDCHGNFLRSATYRDGQPE